MIIKVQLLKTNYFIDNVYLDDYLALINSSKQNQCYQEKHHILNEAYFKKFGLPVDNSDSNIVWLSFKDHCKAHYLLYFCTIGFLKKVNEFAFTGMLKPLHKTAKQLNQYKIEENLLTDSDLEELQTYMENIINDTNSQFWSSNELQLLIQYYPKEGYAIYKRFPNRSKDTVKQKAVALGLRVENHYWTNEQIAILINNYPGKSLSELCKLINRPYNSVKNQVAKLKRKGIINENIKGREAKN